MTPWQWRRARTRKVQGLNAKRAYGIDPEATRCGVAASELAALVAQTRPSAIMALATRKKPAMFAPTA